MIAVELGLRAIALSLEIPSEKRNWNNILDQIRAKIGSRDHTGWARLADKVFFSDIHTALHAIKDGWRNPAMHVERSHTDDDAKAIFDFVSAFMKQITSRLDESGEPKA
jgi:hypothetical protein